MIRITRLAFVASTLALVLWPARSVAQPFECNDGVDNDDPEDAIADFNPAAPLSGDPHCHTFYDDEESPPLSSSAVKPRLLIIFDTSGSMAWRTCSDNSTSGDGSAECPGSDVSCSTCNATGCGNGIADDSRIFKVKEGIADAVAAFGEIEWGLMRFQQNPVSFSCVGGGWDGPGDVCDDTSPGTGRNRGEVVTAFGPDSTQSLLKWMDHVSNLGPNPASGNDWELRAEGNTPLEGALVSASEYIAALKAAEPGIADCRPYAIVLVTDGIETCDGDPVSRAALISEDPTAPVPVFVIGFASTSQTITDQLNAIADAGDGDDGTTTNAVLVDNPADLANAVATIAASVIRSEIACNLIDDDCDLAIDEGFPSEYVDDQGNPQLGPECQVGQGVCLAEGNQQCVDNVGPPWAEFECSASPLPANCPGGLACCAVQSSDGGECCNGLDDDCDGSTDENTIDCNCSPIEFCNGDDDDCDGETDEGTLPGEGVACLSGLDGIGICTAGVTDCQGGTLVCDGGQAPIAETCDGRDENCNTLSDTDELDRTCYTGTATFGMGGALTQGCDPNDSGNCLGNCQHGIQECLDLDSGPGESWGFGTCVGQVVPGTETCNAADDDCDDNIDEDFQIGQACSIVTSNPTPGVAEDCTATGVFVCDASGNQVCNAIPIPPTPEVCDDTDNDCDGIVDENLPSPVGDTCGSGGGGGCGTGTFVCEDGELICQFDGESTDEVCDGINNDCDSFTDEEFPFQGGDCTDDPLAYDPPAADGDRGECEYGSLVCENGTLACDGYVGPAPEICDGKDNDCDGEDDNFAECPGDDELCLEGTCAFPCDDVNEFRCPFGFVCQSLSDGMGGMDDFCVPDPCRNVTCDPGFNCNSDTGTCVDLCEDVSCAQGAICSSGFCIDCFTYGCDAGEVCVTNLAGVGVCETDLCAGVECGDQAYCSGGSCISLTCEPDCGSGERCVDGECVTDRCGNTSCGEDAVCNPETGDCIIDACAEVNCGRGEVCVSSSGECVADPCTQVQCPEGLFCETGFTGNPECNQPKGDLIYAGGGGCNTTGSSPAGWYGLLMLGLFFWRGRSQLLNRDRQD